MAKPITTVNISYWGDEEALKIFLYINDIKLYKVVDLGYIYIRLYIYEASPEKKSQN